jgi:hypothetical protein
MSVRYRDSSVIASGEKPAYRLAGKPGQRDVQYSAIVSAGFTGQFAVSASKIHLIVRR